MEYELTRQRLVEGVLLNSFRADPPAGMLVRTDEELDASFAAALGEHDPAEDVHVFGYGSLMWNPAMEVVQTRLAQVHGWHRRFCFRLLVGRGSALEPGAMVALDRGGTCRGLLFRIEAAKVQAELRLLWRREMISDSYMPRWVRTHAGGQAIRALTFVANRSTGRYLAHDRIDDVAHLIRTGQGTLGTSRDYFESLLATLETHGIRDSGIERLRQTILRADRLAASP
ncbi:gamma-glutamylcyclotransferase [Variovorax sp. JS1663]|uniref:gamma-glutamylcyclotransferase n=1 Tax=Variovorax sp. JS1663 TaxID=1851577 RepID=UPI000B34561F|nr:gamma-glutamylcyclotransferase [Variovorax sp. JS1663]OUM02840.1 hypothetical protein A8M77_09590 [Variovorax sp. JS1663]